MSEAEANEDAGGEDECYMRHALHVAEAALEIGEVPVGCVLVFPAPQGPVIVSHGANQVNATRDPTRHAELVAIDRVLTLGASSDRMRLPPGALLRPGKSQQANNAAPSANFKRDDVGEADKQDPSPNRTPQSSASLPPRHPQPGQQLLEEYRRRDARWTNDAGDARHWTNEFGWGTGHTLSLDELSHCTLYVTCEPCVMCAAALSRVRIRRVVFGCRNDRFGGTGSLLKLHLANDGGGGRFGVTGGVGEAAAVELLRSFYHRENCYAPVDKRKRKAPMIVACPYPEEGNDDRNCE